MKLKANLAFFGYVLIILNDVVSSSISIYDEKNATLINIDDLAAAFGPRLPDGGFIGFINSAEPIHGCTTIKSPPNISYIDPKQWIALIKRTPTKYGNCSFDLKVFNAQQAGYSAVIIFNSESDNLIRMSSSGAFKIQIPSVFIGKSSGILIDSSYTYKNKTFVIITNEDGDISYLLIPFICVVSICFVIAISIFVVKFAIHFYKIRKNRFPKSALKKIPTKKYQKSDKYDTCPICLNEYEEGVKIRILPCEHAYHIECIDKWLLRNNRLCPVCKRKVLPGGSDSESSDESTDNTSTTNINTTNRRSSITENQPNEEDDTNESSRLLVNVRTSLNEDNISALTLNTATNNANNPNQINDLSSLNNQMTTSQSSSQMLPQQMGKDCLRSSSRYGSISSVNNILNTNNIGQMPQTSKLVDDQIEDRLLIKDSTPVEEYFTPMDGATSLKLDSEISNNNASNTMKKSKATKKATTKKIKKSVSSNQINPNVASTATELAHVRIENEINSSASSSASFASNQDSDMIALIKPSKSSKTRKSKSARSLSPKSKVSHDSSSSKAQDKKKYDDEDDDDGDDTKLV